MTTTAPFLTLAMLVAIAACAGDPGGINAPQNSSAEKQAPTFSANAIASSKTSISGTITNSVPGIPGGFHQTPSGRCQYRAWPNVTQFTGDVSGTVTFLEKVNAPCDISDIVASGPVSGEVTWNGRTGEISGQWTTNCVADASQPPLGLSCAGVMNLRGSGELDGVHFKVNWGPGWFPFPYTGTASSD